MIASPLYGSDNYPSNSNCSWRIIVPKGMVRTPSRDLHGRRYNSIMILVIREPRILCHYENMFFDQIIKTLTSRYYEEIYYLRVNLEFERTLTNIRNVFVVQNVLLKFDKFSLELPFTGTTCYDAVIVYDGGDVAADVVGSYCGDGGPGEILSSTNELYVVFQSDKSNTAPGFLASFSAKQGSGTVDGR